MELITLIANALAAVACAYAALRLLFFRRQNRRYRRAFSVAAWVLINVCFFAAGWLMTAGFANPFIAIYTALLCLVFAWEVHSHNGNLSEALETLRRDY